MSWKLEITCSILMGLNGNYDQDHILSMGHLPSVNRAYYILQQIEKKRQVMDVFNVKNDAEAVVISESQGHNSVGKKNQKKNKFDKFCDHWKRGNILQIGARETRIVPTLGNSHNFQSHLCKNSPSLLALPYASLKMLNSSFLGYSVLMLTN